jgi:putative SOS response-associated peptidase YedK
MCGRVAVKHDADWLRRRFGTVNPPVNFPPAYNGAPTDQLPVVRLVDGARHLDLLRWGLVPMWAKDLKIGAQCINARVETVAAKPAFRDAYRRRRCLIPVTAFYEWKGAPGSKQPYAIAAAQDDVLTLAGLWERWRSPEGETIETCAVVTGPPNTVMAELHNRMPVILGEADWPVWLGEHEGDVAGLMRPCPDEWLRVWPVSKAVNSVRNKGAELLDEVAA